MKYFQNKDMRKTFSNWGLYPIKNVEVLSFKNKEQVLHEYRTTGLPDNLIPVGNNRCYGDANMSSVVVDTKNWNNIISFDKENAILHCESGCTLDDILNLIIPYGFFLPVTPGTKFITIGGALASDIHGKNHHVDGVFSDHVVSFGLIDLDGEFNTVTKENPLFIATAGGMGLTGIITDITFLLKKINNSYIDQTAIRAKNLEHVFELFEKNQEFTYSVAWIDCLAKKENLGRSVLLLGEHNTSKKSDLKKHKNPFLNIPIPFPNWFLNSLFIKIFNLIYYFKPSSSGHSTIHYDNYFYPLDKINNWNRIYGKKGFIQWQCVIPKNESYEGMKKILTILSDAKIGSFLAVLKLFGKSHEHRELHFPMEGYTLALDIKINAAIWPILDKLDNIVTQSGGKIYLTKDARMNKQNFDAQYKNFIVPTKNRQSYQMTRLNQPQKDVLLILGANSDIAKSIALEYIKLNPSGYLLLAGRNELEIRNFIELNNFSDVAIFIQFDASLFETHSTFVSTLPLKPSMIVYAAGILAENVDCEKTPTKFIDMCHVNFTGAVNVINILVNDYNPFLNRIIGISSIAGLRGRKSNFYYGSTKAAFHQFLFGLRQQLSERNIIVQSCTPGFVETKMTKHIELPKIANTPYEIARSIIKNKSKFEIYPNLKWILIGYLVKFLPEFIIKKI